MDPTIEELQTAQFEAAVRWAELGSTSATHPVLRVGEQQFLNEMGVQCHYVFWDGLSSDLTSSNLPLIVEPSIDPEILSQQGSLNDQSRLLSELITEKIASLDGQLTIKFEKPYGPNDQALLQAGVGILLKDLYEHLTIFVEGCFFGACLPRSPPLGSVTFIKDPKFYIQRTVDHVLEEYRKVLKKRTSLTQS